MKQKATQLIRDNAPWLRELSFGCEVKDCCYAQHLIFVRKTNVSNRCQCIGVNNGETSFEKTYGESQLEIIGHPITIGDVLRVLGTADPETAYTVDSYGNIDDVNRLGEYLTRYDLTQPFDNQSDEFYRSIVELLGKE